MIIISRTKRLDENENKTYQYRVRMNKEEYEMLEKLSAGKKIPKSELIRKGVRIQYNLFRNSMDINE